MQNAEQRQDLNSRQAKLSQATDKLTRAERELAAVRSEHAHQLGRASQAVDEAAAGHAGDKAVKGQLESLRIEYQQAGTFSNPYRMSTSLHRHSHHAVCGQS